ncbi:uncharacterized protein LOC125715441 isoform X4 [Brienomyrus brachyistius]|uniref:uncharacterized protein LOC125715441 isoform X4 n=1 Tax=Brienomyrus brachyistius TaxID=42636 RepID=UPI0020B232BF|nr:uncharacterized protein LOC125715441 isoform X4 [Brienomyrus brachyistius]
MHYGADMCLPRKKKVIQSFRSNTHRIFDEKVPDRLDANKIYNHHTYQRRTSEEINQLKTHNIPHPRNAKYIRSNVRFLNEPMAYIDVQFQQLVLQVPRNHCWRRYVSFISLIQGNHRTKHMKERPCWGNGLQSPSPFHWRTLGAPPIPQEASSGSRDFPLCLSCTSSICSSEGTVSSMRMSYFVASETMMISSLRVHWMMCAGIFSCLSGSTVITQSRAV